jgi:DinB superfamily
MIQDQELRKQLVNLLTARQAHVDFEDAVANFPAEHINTRAPNCSYTFWHLLEHLRICQNDILEYITAEHYSAPKFPDDLWPEVTAQTTLEGWQKTIEHFMGDRQQLLRIIQDPLIDLFTPLPNSGQQHHTIVREINIIASHNAYHTGQLIILRKMLNSTPL